MKWASVNDEGRALMVRDVKVLQAALTNLIARGTLPAKQLSLAYAEGWVSALSLPEKELLVWARQTAHPYTMKQLTPIVMGVGAVASTMGRLRNKKEQQELISALGDIAAERA